MYTGRKHIEVVLVIGPNDLGNTNLTKVVGGTIGQVPIGLNCLVLKNSNK